MLIIFLFAIVFVAGVLLCKKGDSDCTELCGIFCSIVGIIGLAVCIPLFVGVYVPIIEQNTRTQYEERYKAIKYILDTNNLPGSDVIEQISSYNYDVMSKRRCNKSIWLKDYTFDFYDELPLIELEE